VFRDWNRQWIPTMVLLPNSFMHCQRKAWRLSSSVVTQNRPTSGAALLSRLLYCESCAARMVYSYS